MSFEVGEWVRTVSKGIWRIEQKMPAHYAPRFSLSERKKLQEGTTYFLKRMVNDKWKSAFEKTAAHESAVKRLTKADSRKLERFLTENGHVLEDFDSFQRPVDAILNLGFTLPRRSDFSKFKREFAAAFSQSLVNGMTNEAILKLISETNYAEGLGGIPQSATLQFISKDHEVKRRHLIYRELNVHSF